MRRQAGFTLVELIIVIAMIIVVTAITIPGIISWLPNYRLRSAAQDLLSNIQKAKLEAVKRNIVTSVSLNNTGYTVFVDTGPDFVYNSGDPVVVAVKWSSYPEVSVVDNTFDNSSGQNCIGFRSNGIPVDKGGGIANGRLGLRVPSGRVANVVVSQAGSVSINTILPP